MLSVEYKNSVSEVLDIINNMEEIYKKKISQKFMQFLQKNKSDAYTNHINPEIEINKQIQGKRTREILAIIAYNYWYNDIEKENYRKQLKKNEEERQTELQQKYNTDNLFKKQEKVEEHHMILVEEKKWYTKIIDKIRKFFRLK